jgi:hypothetical protein
MRDIPLEFQRITEQHIDTILHAHLCQKDSVAVWFFGRAFRNAKLIAIDACYLHRTYDHRAVSNNPLAFGENDVEIVAAIQRPGEVETRVGLLIEDKVDARQGINQAERYRARAEFRVQDGSWSEFKCVLVAPQKYLEAAYPEGDVGNSGWDCLISFEDIAACLKSNRAPTKDIDTILGAASLANSWNKPIPEAVQFWKDLSVFQRAFHPEVPIFAAPQQGARINVWPSFYENQLRNNKREVRRKRIQLVHAGKRHVSLFVKNVSYRDFLPVAQPLLESGMSVGSEGKTWQSIQIQVPEIDPLQGVQPQAQRLDEVFIAVRRLYQFYEKNEAALLSVPVSK